MSYDMNLASNVVDNGGLGSFVAVLGGMFLFVTLISLAISIFYIIVYWKIFKKANQEGWAAIIPIYNLIIMMKITEMPLWWLALILIPGVNFIGTPIFLIFWSLNMAKVFNKDTTFGVLTIFFAYVTLPILAFSDAQYIGLSSNNNQQANVQDQPLQPNTNNLNQETSFDQSVAINETTQEMQSTQEINSVNEQPTVQSESNISQEVNTPTWTNPNQDQNNNNV